MFYILEQLDQSGLDKIMIIHKINIMHKKLFSSDMVISTDYFKEGNKKGLNKMFYNIDICNFIFFLLNINTLY